MTRERGWPHEGYMGTENHQSQAWQARLPKAVLDLISVQPAERARAGGRQKAASTHAAQGGALNDT